MTDRAAALRAKLLGLPGEIARLEAGIGELGEAYRDLIRAHAPPNVQYERERIIAQLANPREMAFVLGLLSEGENEAALLLELICTVVARSPHAEIGHLVDEAWYYLRTSIDAQWQLDDGPPSVSAALAYLCAVLDERLQRLRALPATRPLADTIPPEREPLLRSLRAELTVEP